MEGVRITGDDDIVIKCLPEDFIVKECPSGYVLFGNSKHESKGGFSVYLLTKCGLRTLDAIAIISETIGLDMADIKYLGLKDEDAITSQYLFMPIEFQRCCALEKRVDVGPESYFALRYLGLTNKKPVIGGIIGNVFTVTLRNMERNFADVLFGQGFVDLRFPNYYGLQRFGKPNCAKRGHEIGDAIIQGDITKAANVLQECGDSGVIGLSTGSKLSVSSLDPRYVQLLTNASSSKNFNKRLADLVSERCKSVVWDEMEGHSFAFSESVDAEEELRAIPRHLQSVAYYVDSRGKIGSKNTKRRSAALTTVLIRDVKRDHIYPGRYCQTLEFYLPSGSYATVMLGQLYWYIKGLARKS